MFCNLLISFNIIRKSFSDLYCWYLLIVNSNRNSKAKVYAYNRLMVIVKKPMKLKEVVKFIMYVIFWL